MLNSAVVAYPPPPPPPPPPVLELSLTLPELHLLLARFGADPANANAYARGGGNDAHDADAPPSAAATEAERPLHAWAAHWFAAGEARELLRLLTPLLDVVAFAGSDELVVVA